MFDSHVPASMRELPGRVIRAPEFSERTKRSHAERLAQMREYSRRRKQERQQREAA